MCVWPLGWPCPETSPSFPGETETQPEDNSIPWSSETWRKGGVTFQGTFLLRRRRRKMSLIKAFASRSHNRAEIWWIRFKKQMLALKSVTKDWKIYSFEFLFYVNKCGLRTEANSDKKTSETWNFSFCSRWGSSFIHPGSMESKDHSVLAPFKD